MTILPPWIDFSTRKPPIDLTVFFAFDLYSPESVRTGYIFEDDPGHGCGPQLMIGTDYYDGDSLPVAWMEIPPIVLDPDEVDR